MIIRIAAATYADQDDCLAAAAADYAAAHNLEGWDLDARWEDDQRDTIILTTPDREMTTAESLQQAWTAGYRHETTERAEAEATSIDQDWAEEETRYTFADGSAWITSGPSARVEAEIGA